MFASYIICYLILLNIISNCKFTFCLLTLAVISRSKLTYSIRLKTIKVVTFMVFMVSDIKIDISTKPGG